MTTSTINHPSQIPTYIHPSDNVTSGTISTGRKFVSLLDQNKFNLMGAALAAALLITKVTVLGSTILSFVSYNIFSNVIATQTWIPRTIRQFIVEKGGIIVSAVTGIALIAAQSHVLGVALLIYASYKFADSAGIIPRNISLFIERYFSWRALLSVSMPASPVLAALNIASLASYLPPVEQFFYEKFDLLTHKLLKLKGPTIEAIKAPYNPNPTLSFKKINDVLNAKDSEYTLDIGHCTRSVTDTITLKQEDRDFNKLSTLAKSISWSDCRKEIMAHSSFQKFLQEEFPWVAKDELSKNPIAYVDKLAENKGLTITSYTQKWLQERFEKVVDLLNGKWGCRVKGSQSELDDAIADTAKILPYLESLKHKDAAQKNELKPLLFKLALQSSSLQSQNIKNVAAKVLHEITEKSLKEAPTSPVNLARRYEFKVRSALQDARLQTIQDVAKRTYSDIQKFYGTFSPPTEKQKAENAASLKQPLTEDDLAMQLHRDYLSYWFLPLSKYERNYCYLPIQYGAKIGNHLFDSLMENKPKDIYETYKRKIDFGLINSNTDEFWSYIEQLLNSHQLTQSEQTLIRDQFSQAKRSDPETQKKFRRLLLVSLGLLKKAA